MKILNIKYEAPHLNDSRVACIGFFDGVHLGHQELIKETIKVAKKLNIKPALFTFEKSPKEVLKKEKIKYLTTNQDKMEILESLGIEEMIILKFDEKIANYSKEEFMEKIIYPLGIRTLVFGYDFRFAKNGEGNSSALKLLQTENFSVVEIPEVIKEGEKISTTRISKLLLAGYLEQANRLLGHNYKIKGMVVRGYGNGKKFGYPTANIDTNAYVLPKKGVYAVEVKVNNKIYKGMANIGNHPTVIKTKDLLLEVNIFDFDKDIYGQIIEVFFLYYIRDEIKFSSIDELIKQMDEDKRIVVSCIDNQKNI